MVRVFFELPNEQIMSTSKYFNNAYQEEWLDEWAKRVISEVDNSELISEGLVNSDILGPITIKEISGGSKALIMMKHDKSVIVNANSCGDNCAALLAELSKEEEFSIYISYPINFTKYDFDMIIDRDNVVCHQASEFEKEYLKWKQNMIL